MYTLYHFLNGSLTIAVYTPFTPFHVTVFTLLLPWSSIEDAVLPPLDYYYVTYANLKVGLLATLSYISHTCTWPSPTMTRSLLIEYPKFSNKNTPSIKAHPFFLGRHQILQ